MGRTETPAEGDTARLAEIVRKMDCDWDLMQASDVRELQKVAERLAADRDRWKKRTAGWCEMWSAAESANATLAAKLVEAEARLVAVEANLRLKESHLADLANVRGKLAAAEAERDSLRTVVANECPIGALDIATSLRVELHHTQDALADSEASAEHWQAEYAILKAANQLDLEHALAESARAEGLARRVDAMRRVLADMRQRLADWRLTMDEPVWAILSQCIDVALATSDPGGKT